MESEEQILEYELIDICIDCDYEEGEETVEWNVCEDDSLEKAASDIEYDADGVPMGNTREERLVRREILHKFIQQWREQHKENPWVFNEQLDEYIKINQVFLLESVLHSAIRYPSTRAVMKMEEVINKAKIIGEVRAKEGNSNQKPFEKMIIMRYDSDELGSVKMTVGVRNRTHEKVEYSITVPEEGIPFFDESLNNQKKQAKKKKHHK